jgi:CubicO group peptidase (beta-lactamase class C family)
MHASRPFACARTALVLGIILAAFTLGSPSASAADSVSTAQITSIVRTAMARDHLKAVIVQVRSNGRNIFTGAFGDSMTGVPATPDMHFRNGALAFTYMSTLLLEFVDQKKVTLQTKVSNYFPNLPNANRVTLKDLAQMTSGYADYVYQPEFQRALYRDPFRRGNPTNLSGSGRQSQFSSRPGKTGVTRTRTTLSSAKCWPRSRTYRSPMHCVATFWNRWA